MQALDRKQFARHGADMFLIGRVDLIAPLTRLVVQIVPTGECTTGKKVILYKMERSLNESRTVGVAALVRHEAESETLSKRLHLGHGNHFSSRAAQYHHVRVVDHHAFDHATHLSQRIGEKYLAVESLKSGIDLEKQQVRITQHCGSGLCLVRSEEHTSELQSLRH